MRAAARSAGSATAAWEGSARKATRQVSIRFLHVAVVADRRGVRVVVGVLAVGFERGQQREMQLVAVGDGVAARLLGERVDVVVGGLEGDRPRARHVRGARAGRAPRTRPRLRGCRARLCWVSSARRAAPDRGSRCARSRQWRARGRAAGRPRASIWRRLPANALASARRFPVGATIRTVSFA